MLHDQNLGDNEQQNNLSQDHIQLGFVQTFTPPVMPPTLKESFGPNFQKSATLDQIIGSSSSSGPSPMAIRCWAKYFANVDNDLPTVTIPAQWVNFFSLLMLKQGSYEWANEFPSSPAWTLLQQHLGNENSFIFSLPSKQPSVVITDISCVSYKDFFLVNAASPTEEETLQTQPPIAGSSDSQKTAEQSTPPPPSAISSTPPKCKRGKKAPICEVNLRRSDTLHNQHKGFKSPICKDKNCIGCNPNPPVLSPSVVRDLGTTFCNLDPVKLIDATLNVKSQKGVIDKPKSKKLKMGKGSDVVSARKDKDSSKPTKKPHKGAKDASDPDTDAGPSMGTKN
jgi:hypothetical protein